MSEDRIERDTLSAAPLGREQQHLVEFPLSTEGEKTRLHVVESANRAEQAR